MPHLPSPSKPMTHRMKTYVHCMLLLSAMVILAGCAGGPSRQSNDLTVEDFQQQFEADERVTEINERLMMMAVEGAADQVYRVGPDDHLRVNIFGVSELSDEYRVNGAGEVLLPLVGPVAVSGLTLSEVEQAIAGAYDETYLRDPHVSVEVTDFRSQQFTLMGAVSSPRVYSVSRQTTLLEAIAMGGGLRGEAGGSIYLTDRIRDPESGQLGTRSVIIDIEELMQNPSEYNFVLGDSAMINVPRGGYIYVEGAVNSPGAYRQRADTTVLKAIVEAGGLSFEARRSNIYVLQRNPDTGNWEQHSTSYYRIRRDPAEDITLSSGDIVVVRSGPVRAGLSTMVQIVTPLRLLGFRPL